MNWPDQPSPDDEVVRNAVEALFDPLPSDGAELLIVGVTDALVSGVVEYYDELDREPPSGVVVETRVDHVDQLRDEFSTTPFRFFGSEFLDANFGTFDYILGNPPRASPKDIENTDRVREYRDQFELTGKGRPNFSFLYLEQALEHLADGGRVTMFLDEMIETARSASPLRQRLVEAYHVESIQKHIIEKRLRSVVTVADAPPGPTEAPVGKIELPADGEKWSHAIQGAQPPVESDVELEDICEYVGAGVVTGNQKVFTMGADEVPPQLRDTDWVRPAIGGRQLVGYDEVQSDLRVICPYRPDGTIARPSELGEDFMTWAELHRDELEDRSLLGSQRWYAWTRDHGIDKMFQPKILTPEMVRQVKFWYDESGEYVPFQSLRYLIPEEHVDIDALLEYLNSEEVAEWIQSSSPEGGPPRINLADLRELPVPERFAQSSGS